MKLSKYLVLSLSLLTTFSLHAQSSYVFWSDSNGDDNGIYRTGTDGTDTQLVTTNGNAVSLATDNKNQKIYWYNNFDGQIERSNFDGTGREVIVASGAINYLVRFDTVNQKLYYLTLDGMTYKLQLVQANPDGTNAQTLYESEAYDYINEITLDPLAERIYLITDRFTKISGDAHHIELNMSDGTVLNTSLLSNYNYSNINLSADRSVLYFGYGTEISQIDLNTKSTENLFTVPDHVNRSAFDPVTNQFFYGIFRQSNNGIAISKSAADGSNYQDIVSPETIPTIHTDAVTVFNLDTDGDGTADALDQCPNDVSTITPGACGCGIAVTDLNNNGIPDCYYNEETLAIIKKVSKRLNRFYVKDRAQELFDYISVNVSNIHVNNNEDIVTLSGDVLKMAKRIVKLKRKSAERSALKRRLQRKLNRLNDAVDVTL